MGVSEQSPWGTPPPPSQPWGPPQPPHQPQHPSHPEQPGAGGWGPPTGGAGYGPGGPGSGGGSYGGGTGGYGGPPHRKRRAGLVVAVVAGVVAIAAAIVVTLVVAGEQDPGSADESASTESVTSADPTDGPSDEPSDSPGGGADEIVGDGYVYTIPSVGWQDALDEAAELPGAQNVDTFLILGSSVEFAQSNIIVESLSAGGAEQVEDLENLWKRNLAGSDGATPVDLEDRDIDGTRAIGVSIDDRLNNGGVPIRQIAYLMVHEGNQYSIGLSLPASGDTTSETDFEAVLSSWRWTS